ncbi:MAG: glycosyltransferase family 4 protein [Terracidiphilus sp.]|jgi:glycosyltransferase involved in cell wall biosynthesis
MREKSTEEKTAIKMPLIVCCSPGFAEGWHQLGPGITGEKVQWDFFDDRPIYFWEKVIRRPNVAMIRACLQAVIRAARGKANLLITHDPRASFWCALFCRIFRIRIDHYVDSFNFAELPVGLRHRFMSYAFQQITKLAVHSSMECDLYSKYFNIPLNRIQLRLWSIGVPEAFPERPLQDGRYVSSIGGNGRDYRTLIDASRMLSDIPFVLVVRPESLVGLTIPPNVRVLVNAPLKEAMNILLHSAFTVLPLSGSTVPCGHVTLVCAMHLAKAIVATDSMGISDYVMQDYNGVLCKPFSSESLAEEITKLWEDPRKIARLSKNSQEFGAENCSEARMRSDLAAVLTAWNIPLCAEALHAEALPEEVGLC